MKINEFIESCKKAKGVTFVKDNSKKDVMGIWNVDIQIWSKSKWLLKSLSKFCPNDFDITYINGGEYMMQVYLTAKTDGK